MVNKILGVSKHCLVLSEINPSGCVMEIEDQAYSWFKILNENDNGRFKNYSYTDKIRTVKDLLDNNNIKLIIRDWTTCNFLNTEKPFERYVTMELEQKLYLEHVGIQHDSIVVTRKGINVWNSIRRTFANMADLSLEEFSEAYLQYSLRVKDFRKIKLEDIQENPKSNIVKLYEMLGIPECDVENVENDFFKYNYCTGNNKLNTPQSSSTAKIIEKSSNYNNNIFQSNEILKEADYLLGYEC